MNQTKNIVVLSQFPEDPEFVLLETFFWLDEAGWCFGYGEGTDYCAYGILEKDLVEIDSNYEADINKFLASQPKSDREIPVSKFFDWLENNGTPTA